MFELQDRGAAAGLDAAERTARAKASPEPYSLLRGLSDGSEPDLPGLEAAASGAFLQVQDPDPDQDAGSRQAPGRLRRAMPGALILSLICHLALLWTIAMRLVLSGAALQPRPEPPTLPVRFVRPLQPHRYEFPDARKSKEKV